MGEAILPHITQSGPIGAPELKVHGTYAYTENITMMVSQQQSRAYAYLSLFADESVARNADVPSFYSFTNVRGTIQILDILSKTGSTTGNVPGNFVIYPYILSTSSSGTRGKTVSKNLGIMSKGQTVSFELPNMYWGAEVTGMSNYTLSIQAYLTSSSTATYSPKLILSGTVTLWEIADS